MLQIILFNLQNDYDCLTFIMGIERPNMANHNGEKIRDLRKKITYIDIRFRF